MKIILIKNEILNNECKLTIMMDTNEMDTNNFVPTNEELLDMVIKLNARCTKLEQQFHQTKQKHVRKSSASLQLLNMSSLPNNLVPPIDISNWIETITVTIEDINNIIENSARINTGTVFSVIQDVLKRHLSNAPLFPVDNEVYVYRDNVWIELTQSILIKITKRVSDLLLQEVRIWKLKNASELDNNDSLCIRMNKAVISISGINYRGTLSHVRNGLYKLLHEKHSSNV